MGSRHGFGRHRQSWIKVICPTCEQVAEARRTVPGKPLHVKAHFTAGGDLCACDEVVTVVAA